MPDGYPIDAVPGETIVFGETTLNLSGAGAANGFIDCTSVRDIFYNWKARVYWFDTVMATQYRAIVHIDQHKPSVVRYTRGINSIVSIDNGFNAIESPLDSYELLTTNIRSDNPVVNLEATIDTNVNMWLPPYWLNNGGGQLIYGGEIVINHVNSVVKNEGETIVGAVSGNSAIVRSVEEVVGNPLSPPFRVRYKFQYYTANLLASINPFTVAEAIDGLGNTTISSTITTATISNGYNPYFSGRQQTVINNQPSFKAESVYLTNFYIPRNIMWTINGIGNIEKDRETNTHILTNNIWESLFYYDYYHFHGGKVIDQFGGGLHPIDPSGSRFEFSPSNTFTDFFGKHYRTYDGDDITYGTWTNIVGPIGGPPTDDTLYLVTDLFGVDATNVFLCLYESGSSVWQEADQGKWIGRTMYMVLTSKLGTWALNDFYTNIVVGQVDGVVQDAGINYLKIRLRDTSDGTLTAAYKANFDTMPVPTSNILQLYVSNGMYRPASLNPLLSMNWAGSVPFNNNPAADYKTEIHNLE